MAEALDRVLLFPIRHHSPACAWQLERLIAARRPRAVLIEGPRDATPLIAHLVDPALHAPVAIYTTWVDSAGLLGRAPDRHNGPARFAAYYPLADFSPELVALRAGHAAGAELAFIDLSFPELVLAEHGAVQEQTRSLLDERYFRHSRFLQALCERTGARDSDDLWDHLYETDFATLEPDEFIRRAGTYCELARADYTPAMLDAEGHRLRETAMAQAIRATAARVDGLVLVVTGGFHTAGLRALLEQPAGEPAAHPRRRAKQGDTQAPVQIAGEAQTLLMRYGFAQLDRLNGYASGMPAPAFYQRIWEQLHRSQRKRSAPPANLPALSPVAAEFIVELGRQSRARGPGLSPADEIAALDQTLRLAAFRGHPQPAREDLLDGIRSALVKGSTDAEGLLLLEQARRLLAGDRIGQLPPGVAVAPLVQDFRRAAAQQRLEIDTLEPRELALDLYRSVRHRATSRLLHRLIFLAVPFAHWRAGPDFVARTGLERVQELWRYGWQPDTESALTERSVYGGTLEEACATLLRERLRAEDEQGQGRRADRAAEHLLSACRMGLHRFTPELLAQTAALVAEDAAFPSLVRTAEQLLLLERAREPLEAHGLAGLRETALKAYQRACFLLPTLGATAEAEERAVLDALNTLQQLSLGLGGGPAAERLRQNGLRALLDAPDTRPALRGAAAGSLFVDGVLDQDELVRLAVGHMRLGGPEFLRGLLRADRACLWQVPDLLSGLNEAIRTWDEPAFVRQLPALRLAFAGLTAHECDRVAVLLAGLLGLRLLPSLHIDGATAADLLTGAALNARLAELLSGERFEF
ncbi:MAG: DUF5682 family protein [Roseiflexaceae bacterium]